MQTLILACLENKINDVQNDFGIYPSEIQNELMCIFGFTYASRLFAVL